MTKARIREIRAQAKALYSKAPSPQAFTESNMLTTAAMLTECLLDIEAFNRRARRGEDLSQPPEELPLAARTNPTKKARGTREEIGAYALEIGLTDDDAEWFWLKMVENDWKVGKQPVKDWKARMRQWSIMKIFPSQKNAPKTPPPAATGPARCTL